MNLSIHPLLVLFDGVCNLCERSVRLVIRNDRRRRFRFASLQSPTAKRILAELDYRHDELSSVLLIEDGVLYRKSRAALRIARRMDRAWPLMFYLLYWIPAAVADPVYDFVGSRRYRWFGRKEECWIPNDDLRALFLDESAVTDRDPTGGE